MMAQVHTFTRDIIISTTLLEYYTDRFITLAYRIKYELKLNIKRSLMKRILHGL